MVEPTKTLLLVVSDGPNLATGLARIARELMVALQADMVSGALPNCQLAQLGMYYDGQPFSWRVFPIRDEENWGQADVLRVCGYYQGLERVILFSIWDPQRCLGISKIKGNTLERWGYFPVDAQGVKGKLSLPAADALRSYKRVLAYGKYGAHVLTQTLGSQSMSWLPHGIVSESWLPSGRTHALQGQPWQGAELPPGLEDGDMLTLDELPRMPDPDSVWVGCVAANQPRKDLALFFDVCAQLRDVYRHPVRVWLHTDLLNKAWSVTELAHAYGFNAEEKLLVTGIDENTLDEELAALYSGCDVTIAPGLGEGFGYPIVESLACGTPVIHGDYAGGAELISPAGWRIPPGMYRVESCHALVRPVFDGQLFAEAADAAIAWKRRAPAEVAAYCRGSVLHLDWRHIWPRWRSWFRAGLEGQEVKG